MRLCDSFVAPCCTLFPLHRSVNLASFIDSLFFSLPLPLVILPASFHYPSSLPIHYACWGREESLTVDLTCCNVSFQFSKNMATGGFRCTLEYKRMYTTRYVELSEQVKHNGTFPEVFKISLSRLRYAAARICTK